MAKYEEKVQKEFSAKCQQFHPAFYQSKKPIASFKMAESLQHNGTGLKENPVLAAKLNRQ